MRPYYGNREAYLVGIALVVIMVSWMLVELLEWMGFR